MIMNLPYICTGSKDDKLDETWDKSSTLWEDTSFSTYRYITELVSTNKWASENYNNYGHLLTPTN